MSPSYQKGKTIAAVATAPGEAAIAIVRISGNEAFSIAEKIFSKSLSSHPTHTAHYGKILHENGEVIDTVLVLILRAPKSYSGEDTVEIFCHGGSIVTRRVLERVVRAGAHPAEPGEFSLKAFRNGKIDLAQAEAVQELISAKNDLALKAAEKQLEGALSKKIASFQTDLTRIAAILEAWVDFPEEDLAFAPFEEILSDLSEITRRMELLASTFHEGKILKEGLTLCLTGTPNVGKSSLMNALLGKDRAIVTEIAGTTRDLLEEDIFLSGLHFRLIDTAGIRNTSEIVEKEGIRRSKKAIDEADLILLVLDASRDLAPEDQELIDLAPKEKSLLIWNKIDVRKPPKKIEGEHLISAKEGIGLTELKEKIGHLIWKKGPPSQEEVFLTKARHHEALTRAILACQDVILGLKQNASPEFVADDCRRALQELSTIIGTDVTEDILTSIFSQFCLGK